MGLKTKIEYVTATHNFWIGGCEKISEGCKNCFAETMYKRFWGKDFSVPIKSKNFDAPLKWKKPQVILVNDMSDFFHKKISIHWKLDALKFMIENPKHIYLLLTKRPENIFEFYKKPKNLMVREYPPEIDAIWGNK
jgi:protein gp37